MYLVKEIYYTIQGEGYHVGRPAVFLRFSGCNLWSGYEKDRKNAICKFCDTDFICLLYTSPSPRDLSTSRMPSSA